MNKKKTLQIGLIVVTTMVLVGLTVGAVVAQARQNRKEAVIKVGQPFDLSVGNAGISSPESQYSGRLVVEKFDHPPNYGLGYFVFTQAMMDARIYDFEGKEVENVYGLVQVYFNLDTVQRRKWDDPDANMSIWYKDLFLGEWVKCPTRLVRAVEAPRGRLVCPISQFGLYAVAWTQPTFEIKLTKYAGGP